jgi:hypothetical protein
VNHRDRCFFTDTTMTQPGQNNAQTARDFHAKWEQEGMREIRSSHGAVVFWDVTPCSLVDRHQRFGQNCCLHLQDDGLYFIHIRNLKALKVQITAFCYVITCSFVDTIGSEIFVASIFRKRKLISSTLKMETSASSEMMLYSLPDDKVSHCRRH